MATVYRQYSFSVDHSVYKHTRAHIHIYIVNMIYSSSCQSNGPSTELPSERSRRPDDATGRYRIERVTGLSIRSGSGFRVHLYYIIYICTHTSPRFDLFPHFFFRFPLPYTPFPESDPFLFRFDLVTNVRVTSPPGTNITCASKIK